MTQPITGLHALIVLLCVCLPLSASGEKIALTNANLFNGADDAIERDVTVLVSGEKIERIIRSGQAIPRDYRSIDCEENFLMPGLFDVHTHLDSLERAQRALESGVTTVRSASVTAFQDVALRELVRAGKIDGPDVVAAGVYVTPSLGDTVLADTRLVALAGGVETDEELRLLVNVNIDRGVDVIKTRGTERAGLPDTDPRQQVYSEHQLRVIVEAAARRNIPVMVHAHGDEGARAAVKAGARSIEHDTYLKEETLRLMQQRGTWLVPTYVTMDEMNEPGYDYVLRLRGRHMVPQLEGVIRAAHKAGVKIATGADNYYDGESINRISVEVENLVRLGMSNFDTLQSATVVSAELLMLQDRTGRIAEGFEADLILVPADPLENVAALQDVLLVMSNGRIALRRIPFSKAD
jgi:imidazolonepropionase-like amidohydrolase